jgi:hypothetical protein
LTNCEKVAARIAAAPKLDDAWTQVACLRLLAGDLKGYQELCRQISQRLSEEKTPFAAFIASRVSVMSPESPIAGSQSVEWVERDVAASKNAWNLHVLGLAHYRAGQFNEAVQRCNQSVREFPEWGHVLNWLVLAMAHHRLGHGDQAAEWLKQAALWRAAIPAGQEAPLPAQDGLEFQVLFSEATAQVTGKIP